MEGIEEGLEFHNYNLNCLFLNARERRRKEKKRKRRQNNHCK